MMWAGAVLLTNHKLSIQSVTGSPWISLTCSCHPAGNRIAPTMLGPRQKSLLDLFQSAPFGDSSLVQIYRSCVSHVCMYLCFGSNSRTINSTAFLSGNSLADAAVNSKLFFFFFIYSKKSSRSAPSSSSPSSICTKVRKCCGR